MKQIRRTYKYFLIIICGLLTISSQGMSTVKYYQGNKINKDGTITISIVYSATNQEIKQSNNLIGNLPFTAPVVREYFAFTGAQVKRGIVYKDPVDLENRMAVTVEIVATDFSKISESKAFHNILAKWAKTDTGAVFSWYVPAADFQQNSIETYQFVLNSDPEIKSSNGLLKDKELRWFVFGNKVDKNGAYFVTTVKAEGLEMESKDTKKPTESKEPKSCGLFGLEFPVVIFFGMILSYNFRRKYIRK